MKIYYTEQILEKFDEYLDEKYGYVNVADTEMNTSEVLFTMYPVRYDQLFEDWKREFNVESLFYKREAWTIGGYNWGTTQDHKDEETYQMAKDGEL